MIQRMPLSIPKYLISGFSRANRTIRESAGRENRPVARDARPGASVMPAFKACYANEIGQQDSRNDDIDVRFAGSELGITKHPELGMEISGSSTEKGRTKALSNGMD